ncbi:olfactory receptor 1020-like [Hemicordylus capensis]|uniref:olfactory receptor 1020-like n=1 Tax=Hemicordylus capensis TaxID=884348 RepID=UPI0023046717|nr:olfactory receptor 1020-like [Hemicordylus capensis]
MDGDNCTAVVEFIFIGLTDRSDLQFILFIFFLLIYVFTVLGNVGLILVVRTDARLQTPMYFFLSNLSFLDMCYSTTITPKMLVSFFALRKTISYIGCITQLYFYAGLATTECYLLAMMASDRYVAICNPLLYTVVVSRRVCIFLVFVSYVLGFLNSTIHTAFSTRFLFGNYNVINHFFCDGPPLMKLTCSDTSLNQILIFAFAGFNEVTTTSIVLISYCCILSNIFRVRSNEGKCKVFSTCTSHLTAVSLFYGTLLFMYLRPSSSYSLEQDKIVAVFYTVVIPFLNPLIYSLRNKDVKDALRRIMEELEGNRLGAPTSTYAPHAILERTEVCQRQPELHGRSSAPHRPISQ